MPRLTKKIKVLDILELVPNIIDCPNVSPNDSSMTPTMIGSQGFREKHKIWKFIVLVPRLQLLKKLLNSEVGLEFNLIVARGLQILNDRNIASQGF